MLSRQILRKGLISEDMQVVEVSYLEALVNASMLIKYSEYSYSVGPGLFFEAESFK